MMRTLFSLFLLMFGLAWAPTAYATTIGEVPNPRDAGVWVTDLADVLSDADEEVINDAIDAIEEETGVEIALVTVDRATAPSPKDFTTGLFNLWGVGKADANNGLLIVLVMSERRLEMETGYGLEAILTDGWLATMQAENMVPHFKEGDFARGLVRGVIALTGRLRVYAEELPQSEAQERRKSTLAKLADSTSDNATSGEKEEPPPGIWCCCCMLVLLLIWSIRRRKRAKRCPHCETKMEPMRDAEVDAMLSPGHRLERAIKSRMFPFLKCPGCNHVHDRPLNIKSAYKTCPDCDFITLEIRVEDLVNATTSSPGRRRIFENCLFCQHRSHHDETTPRKPRYEPSTTRTVHIRDDDDRGGGFFGGSSSSKKSSSGGGRSSSSSSSSSGSSSSGGSSTSGSTRRKKSSGSFGGGKSGGGGAGSSW